MEDFANRKAAQVDQKLLQENPKEAALIQKWMSARSAAAAEARELFMEEHPQFANRIKNVKHRVELGKKVQETVEQYQQEHPEFAAGKRGPNFNGGKGPFPKGPNGPKGVFGEKFLENYQKMEEAAKNKAALVDQKFIKENSELRPLIKQWLSEKDAAAEQAREVYKAAFPGFAKRLESVKDNIEQNKTQGAKTEQAKKALKQELEQLKKAEAKANDGKVGKNTVGDEGSSAKGRIEKLSKNDTKAGGHNKELKPEPTSGKLLKDSTNSGRKSDKADKDFAAKKAQYEHSKEELLKKNQDFAKQREDYKHSKEDLLKSNPSFAVEKADYKLSKEKLLQSNPDFAKLRSDYKLSKGERNPDSAAKRAEYEQSKAELLKSNPDFAAQREHYKHSKEDLLKYNQDFAKQRADYKHSKEDLLKNNPDFAKQKEDYKHSKEELLKHNPDFAAERAEYKLTKAEWMKSNPFTTLSELVVPKHYAYHDPYHDPMKDVAVKGADSGFHTDKAYNEPHNLDQ